MVDRICLFEKTLLLHLVAVCNITSHSGCIMNDTQSDACHIRNIDISSMLQYIFRSYVTFCSFLLGNKLQTRFSGRVFKSKK